METSIMIGFPYNESFNMRKLIFFHFSDLRACFYPAKVVFFSFKAIRRSNFICTFAPNMSNFYFQFKQFTVYHDLCAMKVGTDGVLLGAWTDVSGAQHILDVGCGSGLIALMLAQRCNAEIDAIDLDENACRQTRKNIKLSPFSQAIQVIHGDFLVYHPDKKYDLIVSNPPFFVNSLKSPDRQRSLARHTDDLPFDQLLKHSAQLLSSHSRIALIAPFEQLNFILSISEEHSLYMVRKTLVRSIARRPPKRVLLEFSNMQNSLQENELNIESSVGKFSEEYVALTKDYYLKITE